MQTKTDVKWIIVPLISVFIIYIWDTNMYSKITLTSNLESHINKMYEEAIGLNEDIEIVAHKEIDKKRIILLNSKDDGHTGIVVYKKMFFNSLFQFQDIKMAEYALSTYKIDSPDASFYFVYGDNSTISADTYIFSYNGNRVENKINNHNSFTFDLIQVKAGEIDNEPDLSLYSDNQIIKNRVYFN